MTDRVTHQLFDELPDEEYQALKKDIAERGVLVPIEYDQHGDVIDGHHRQRACTELGITDYPTVQRRFDADQERDEHIVALNTRRRHLSSEQKRRWAGWWLTRHPEQSNREIARHVGVDKNTVNSVRTQLEESGEIHHFPERQDPRTGNLSQPAARPAAAHVSRNGGENEWYTPAEYITAAASVMGGIDLDPASCATANETVKAARFYTAEDDGLKQEWKGRLWMNPPYAQPLIQQFCTRLALTYSHGDVTEACVLVNNATETAWFQELAGEATAVCFPRGRVRFWHPDRLGQPLQGQAVLYLGGHLEAFQRSFAPFGAVASFDG